MKKRTASIEKTGITEIQILQDDDLLKIMAGDNYLQNPRGSNDRDSEREKRR